MENKVLKVKIKNDHYGNILKRGRWWGVRRKVNKNNLMIKVLWYKMSAILGILACVNSLI